jgi:hypothetical protein
MPAPTATPNLALTYLAPSQSQPEVPINDAWNKIDAAVQATGGAAAAAASAATAAAAAATAAAAAAGAGGGGGAGGAVTISDGVTTYSGVLQIVFGNASITALGSGVFRVDIVALEEQSHVYWRVNILGSGYPSNSGFAEIAMASSAGGANLLTGGTVSANGADGGNQPGAAIDGNPATSWNYAGNLSWWQYQFAAPEKIVEVKITARTDAPTTSPSVWQLQFSDDGLNWTTLKLFTAAAWTAGAQQTFSV